LSTGETEKQQYLRKHLLALTHYWFGIVLILGTVLFLLLGVMDYLVTPENFQKFLMLRMAIAATLLCIFIVNTYLRNRKKSLSLLYFFIMLANVLSAVTIEAMILNLGGHSSFYYAGLSLLVICILGLIPLNLTISSVFVLSVYLVYLIPILLLDNITNFPVFFSNNAFLFCTCIIALVWRALGHKNLLKTLSLQYELDKDKTQLELYSTNLERLVDERTRELNKSELMFRSLFELATDGIMLMDPAGTIIKANERACEIHGFEREALMGTNIALLETEENKAVFRERMERILDGESLLYETEHYRKDGTKISLEVSSRAIEVEGASIIQSFHRDVTEKKRLQQQILHSQKMDSIGLLAGGIAHDFNNILTSILGSTELLLLKDDVDEFTNRCAQNIEAVSRQAVNMVSKLLSFARRGSFEALSFSVNSVLNDTMEMVERLIPKDIEVTKELLEPSPAVEGDPSQFEQVVMNLMLNARDAMPGGGKLALRTSVVELGPADLDIDANVTSGQYVRISVSDTGSGIEEEHLAHIFEPFFTTKEKGKGTGLGLAMLYGIVKEHKGYVTLQSTVGEGTTFYVYLPVKEQMSLLSEETHEVRGREGETILAIDDEEAILDFIRDTLSNRGFSVVTESNPRTAVDLYAQNRESIDLIITDMVMPAMDGRQVVEAVRTISPQVKIIVATGFSEDLGTMPTDGFLKKPFSGNVLLRTVRNTLDKKSGKRS
jgi:PAS domain S-box-containing protein